MKHRIFAIALACAATLAAAAGGLTDSSDRKFENEMNAHIDAQIAAGKVVCDGLPELSAGHLSMCEQLRASRKEKEIEQTCKAKKLKGEAFKSCAAPISKKYRLRDE